MVQRLHKHPKSSPLRFDYSKIIDFLLPQLKSAHCSSASFPDESCEPILMHSGIPYPLKLSIQARINSWRVQRPLYCTHSVVCRVVRCETQYSFWIIQYQRCISDDAGSIRYTHRWEEEMLGFEAVGLILSARIILPSARDRRGGWLSKHSHLLRIARKESS